MSQSAISHQLRVLKQSKLVGSRREGETMVPFGRNKPVKLKKLMIDAGVERAMRRSVPVVRGGGEALLAVGLRSAEGCRGNEDEERMLVRFLGLWPDGNLDGER